MKWCNMAKEVLTQRDTTKCLNNGQVEEEKRLGWPPASINSKTNTIGLLTPMDNSTLSERKSATIP